MIHNSTVFHYLIKYGSKVMAYPFRWYYTPKRLSECLMFDVSGSGDPITYQISTQDGWCWLEAYNLSPFELTIDRATVEVGLDGGAKFVCTLPNPQILKPSSHNRMHVKGMSPMRLELFEVAKKYQKATVSIAVYVHCPVQKFETHKYINDLKNVRLQ